MVHQVELVLTGIILFFQLLLRQVEELEVEEVQVRQHLEEVVEVEVMLFLLEELELLVKVTLVVFMLQFMEVVEVEDLVELVNQVM